LAEAAVKKGDILFGQYRVLDLLGEGGQAFVFRGTDCSTGGDVAIKQLKDPDEDLLVRFTNESTLTLPTDHVVKNYKFGEERGVYYNVMEFIEGGDLEGRMEWEDDFVGGTPHGDIQAEGEVKDIIAQAADGLGCAHSHNVIHRDIKPANLMIRRTDNCVKLTDFGIACFLTKERRTELGVQMGSVFWMSPEQVIEPKDVDCRADIWSLGVVFYQAITGRYPFCGTKMADIFRAILSDDPPSPRKVNPSLSEETEAVVLKMLEKSLDERFQRMTDVQKALGAEVLCVLSKCPQCGVETEMGNRFCTGCGYDLVELPMKLVGTGGVHATFEFPVHGDLVHVGRHKDGNDIRLPYDPYVSRWHLQFRKEGTTRTVEAWDWNQGKKPANETLLNGFDINGKGRQPIRVGDKLRMGDSWFELKPD
jgi:serine/threonine protein kinase